ncbi:hydroxyisourate hydrolase [Dyadobacter sp. CY326]|uniref:hydroxyisourate hydrolase n=1 Tax=Dyadobacter sp. CY326 TaxID=2907300 RepID=UPI001F201088|nr:hydroxyisourate hydrolase [Dyadobacter sp. CY326]MCE7065795.1 hydroxyisourate hydrolase [Dyadobacter sp. CY326]
MRNLLLTLGLVLITTIAHSQSKTFQLSSHILDISQGIPASGVPIRLEKMDTDKKTWSVIDEKVTDANGRISDFLNSEKSGNEGIYKLTYLTADYFKSQNIESFYPFIEVVFEIKDSKHYHVPITLSAYGYSTYRGN